MSARPRFAPHSAFHADLRARVERHFAERGEPTTANGAMMVKIAAWIGTFALMWTLWLALPLPTLPWLGMGLLTGASAALMTLNVGHDAVHGALSRRRWVNTLFSWTFDVVGCSSRNWRVSHNGLHHSWTNVPGADADLDPGPLLAFHPGARRPWHRLQHLYAPFLYALVVVNWVYRKDLEQITWRDPITGAAASLSARCELLCGKLLHIGLFVVAPLLLTDHGVGVALAGYAASLVGAGVTLAVIFQMAHCVEGVAYPEGSEGRLPYAWSDHQLHTTANFGATPLSTWMTGGLNHQIEHHLLPHVCHIHLPRLAPIVAACAREHGLPYLHSGSFPAALRSHFRMLRRLGAGPS
jgi:linoleoyl-CoA desaturase